jgi:hypothetical protein
MRSQLFLLVAVLAGAGCTHVTGELAAHGGALDGWRFQPDRCAAGYHAGFFGFDLLRAPDGAVGERQRDFVRVIHDEVGGTVVRVHLREATALAGSVLAFDAGECRQVVSGLLHRWDVRQLDEGWVDVDCTAPDGTRLVGRVDVRWCR